MSDTKASDSKPDAIRSQSGREIKPTEKGRQYQIELHTGYFRKNISVWRQTATKLEMVLVDTNVSVLQEARDTVINAMHKVVEEFSVLGQLLTSGEFGDIDNTYADVEREHHLLMRKVADRMIVLADAKPLSDAKHKEEKLDKTEKKTKHKEGQGTSVNRSARASSKASQVSSKAMKLEFASEAAALRTHLQFLDLENQRKVELEKLQLEKQLAISQAKLNAVAEVEREESQCFSGSERSLPVPEVDSKTKVTEYLSRFSDHTGAAHTSENKVQFDVKGPSHNTTEPLQTQKPQTTVRPSDVQMAIRLPPPEPGIFSGEPLHYPGWKAAFETLIERQNIPRDEKIHYLSRYLSGPAKECVDGYLLLATSDAFDHAKALLDKRYGDSFAIAGAFRDKLDAWQKIHSRDGYGLRKYSDYLKQCQSAMNTIPSLKVLNDDRENHRMLRKLPDWLVTKWSSRVAQWKEQGQGFPPFSVFANFIEREADMACDPVTSLQSLKSEDKENRSKPSGFKQQHKQALSRSFNTHSDSPSTPPSQQSHQTSTNIKKCIFCEKKYHLIDQCYSFDKKTVEEKREFLKKRGACFGCLTIGHRVRNCKNRLTCKICNKLHPTSLHNPDYQATTTNQVTGLEFNSNTNTALSTLVPDQNLSVPTAFNGSIVLSTTGSDSKCSMIVPVYLSHKNKPNMEKLVYALLDTQSDTSFITSSVATSLGLTGVRTCLRLSTMSAADQIIECDKFRDLQVRAHDDVKSVTLPAMFSRSAIPASRDHVPTPEVARKWPHLEKIADHLLPSTACDIGLLIGYNCSHALMPKHVLPPPLGTEAPYGVKTELGWCIVGDTSTTDDKITMDEFGTSHRIMTCEVFLNDNHIESNVVQHKSSHQVSLSFQNTLKEVIHPAQINQMMELEFCERESDSSALSLNDKNFLRQVTAGIRQCSDRHYEIPLPFKGENILLPDNQSQAHHRLMQLKGRFKRDHAYHEDYVKFMDNLLKNGFAECVSTQDCETGEIGKTWYIPHHGVYQNNRPKKLRVVFDCSARHEGHALNDHLLKGPDLTNSLIGVLIRFRKEQVAATCDIKSMFHQFRVPVSHRNYFRFLWWENGDYDTQPKVYRMTVHLFGASSSPGCANFGLKQIANDYEKQYTTEAADFIRKNFYVDDGLTSQSDVNETIALLQDTVKLCSEGGLELHKFTSNSETVLHAVNVQKTETLKVLNNDIDVPIERALGIQWDITLDCFTFRITLKDCPLTRRGIMSTISSIYDPLGFVAPVLLKGRQVLQRICQLGGDWDDQVPEDLRIVWEHWRSDIVSLNRIQIERCYKIPQECDKPVKKIELHHFSDASEHGYGQSSYIRFLDEENQVHCSFVMGKSRVTPTKLITIPRLELTAAVLSVKISNILKRELDYREIQNIYWTDSRVVLGYIANESRRFHVYVANRVQQIRNHTDPVQWNHVQTHDNPADIASRGASVDEFTQSAWLTGPSFLLQHPYSESIEVPALSQDDPEIRKVKSFATVSCPDATFDLARFARFSSWTRLRRAVAWCLRYKAVLQERLRKGNISKLQLNVPLTVDELTEAEIVIFRLVQQDTYQDEFKLLHQSKTDNSTPSSMKKKLKGSSTLHSLDPFLDDDDIIRVGGRLRQSEYPRSVKHPVILPRKSHVSVLLVRHFHELVAHQGRGFTINKLRSSGLWITGCSSIVRSEIFKCVKCRKFRGSFLQQKMSDLPQDRLEPAPPFTFCATDFFGPFLVKEGRKQLKRYGTLFTCMASRAVHIEVCDSLSTDSFINTLRRFIAIRGSIRQLRSDCGTNFIGARNELSRCVEEMDHEAVERYLSDNQCEYMRFNFKTNAPYASHMGGIWERQIRTVRSILVNLMDTESAQLTDESLRTLMYEVMAIINSRPLTTDTLIDPTSLEPLTPNHLLTLKSGVVPPPPGQFVRADLFLRKQWRRVQHMANEFWYRWKHEYLNTLQSRQKWVNKHRDLIVDDIVLLHDETPRNVWKLARVVAVLPDQDGSVRKVRLAISDRSLNNKGQRVNAQSFIERPIHKLVLILESSN